MTKTGRAKPEPHAPIPLEVQWRMLDEVFNERRTLISAAVVMTVVALIGAIGGHAPVLLVWALVGILLQGFRLTLADAYAARSTMDTPALWARRFTYGALTLGLLFGSLAGVVYLPADPFLRLLLITALAACVMAAAVRNNTVPLASHGQVFLSLGPLLLVCLFSHRLDFTMFAAVVLLLIGATCEIARTLHIRSLRLLLTEAAATLANAHLADLNERLEKMATTDGLTGIANRRGFDLLLEDEWKRAFEMQLPIALLLFDIDYFKLLNDSFGHIAGDECLRRIAISLRHNLPDPGNALARYGGEEFIVILGGTDREQAFEIAEILRQEVECLGILNPGAPNKVVTISAGIAATIPLSSNIAEALFILDRADQALYFAKQRGRNQVSDRVRERSG